MGWSVTQCMVWAMLISGAKASDLSCALTGGCAAVLASGQTLAKQLQNDNRNAGHLSRLSPKLYVSGRGMPDSQLAPVRHEAGAPKTQNIMKPARNTR